MPQKLPDVVPFDDKEKELIESIENDEGWKTIAEFESRKKEFEMIAKKTNRKKPITIRLSQADIDAIKMIAANEGMPYQTLISSIMHKYSVGTL